MAGEPPAPAQAQVWLAEALAGWRERYPDVTVHSGVIRKHPSMDWWKRPRHRTCS